MPINFRRIGIDLDVGVNAAGIPLSDLDDDAITADAITEVDDSQISTFGYSATHGRYKWSPRADTWHGGNVNDRRVVITIDGVDFYSLGLAGAEGTFGAALIVRTCSNPNEYILKCQEVSADNPISSHVKETIVGHSLYEYSNTGMAPFETGPACFKTYKIVKGNLQNGHANGVLFTYILMEKGDNIIANLWRINPNRYFLTQQKRLALWLQDLQANYEYVHNDCKNNNIMHDINRHVRIIDFGWNQLLVNGLLIVCRADENPTAWRDFTLLNHSVALFNRQLGDVMDEPDLANYVVDMLSGGVRPYHAPVENLWDDITNNLQWVAGYDFCRDPESINPNAEPAAVINTLDGLGVGEDNRVATLAHPHPIPLSGGVNDAQDGMLTAAILPALTAYARSTPATRAATRRNYERIIAAIVDHILPEGSSLLQEAFQRGYDVNLADAINDVIQTTRDMHIQEQAIGAGFQANAAWIALRTTQQARIAVMDGVLNNIRQLRQDFENNFAAERAADAQCLADSAAAVAAAAVPPPPAHGLRIVPGAARNPNRCRRILADAIPDRVRVGVFAAGGFAAFGIPGALAGVGILYVGRVGMIVGAELGIFGGYKKTRKNKRSSVKKTHRKKKSHRKSKLTK